MLQENIQHIQLFRTRQSKSSYLIIPLYESLNCLMISVTTKLKLTCATQNEAYTSHVVNPSQLT